MNKILIFSAILVFFTACGTKREYYQPQTLEKLNFKEKSIGASIVDFNINIAKLSNNSFIDSKGEIINFKLAKDFSILNAMQDEILTADNDGNFKIYNNAGEELFSYKFNESVVSASVDGDDIALILASNTLVYANKNLGIKMLQNLGNAYAQDSRFANPYFLNTIIIYPMLNGKLAIVSKENQKLIREILIGSEEFFNNVIHLSVVDEKMIAATAQKLIVVSPNRTLYLNDDIKEISVGQNAIFVLTKDGRIIKTDFNLRKINEVKFKFAQFSKSTFYNNQLYVFEKTGYLIKIDSNLEHYSVFEFKDGVDQKSFIKDNKFFYNNKILYLE